MPQIAVITHESDNFAGWKYLLKTLIGAWKQQGIETVVVKKPQDYVPADAAFVHVDLTVVPQETIDLAGRYPVAINRRAVDTRKRAYSKLLLDEDSNYNGPVIVKTDANCGGWREFRNSISASLAGRMTRRLGGFETYLRYRARCEAARPWACRRLLRTEEYPVFGYACAVPKGIWRNPHLIVEKLLCERTGSVYCVRNYKFLGSREGNFRIKSRNLVVKFGGSIEMLDEPVPASVRALREQLGLDYGKIDYAMVDGEPVIYDVNRTTGNADDERALDAVFARLQDGIWDFLPVKGQPARSSAAAHA